MEKFTQLVYVPIDLEVFTKEVKEMLTKGKNDELTFFAPKHYDRARILLSKAEEISTIPEQNNLFLTQNQYDEILKICNSIDFKDNTIYNSIVSQIRIVNKNC